MRAKTERWWHDCSGREDPIANGAGVGKCVKRKYGTMLWEGGYLAENWKV